MNKKEQEINKIMEFKQNKIIAKVINKFPYNWNENQLKTMQLIIQNTPRIRLEDEVIRRSILDENNIIENKAFIKQFFDYQYSYNIKNLMNTCGYTYLDFNKDADNILDAYNKNASFEGFNFSKEQLAQSIFNNNNYVPFYAYCNKMPNKYLICGGRHRMQVLKNNSIKRVFLCIFWDYMPQDINCELWIPNLLLEKSLFLLDLQILEKNEYFSKIKILDATDLWLTLRVLDKEFSYLIDFYPNILKELNILSPKDLLWKELKDHNE